MLRSKSKEIFTLKLRSYLVGLPYMIRVSVFDAYDRVVCSTQGKGDKKLKWENGREITYDLPKGLYTLRLELNGAIKDKFFVFDRNKEFEIVEERGSTSSGQLALPKQYSSALLGDEYGSSHEYYTGPSVEWSQKDTFSGGGTTNSSLYIFLRFPSRSVYEKVQANYAGRFWGDFELVDNAGKRIIDFQDEIGLEIQSVEGWAAFNAELESGIYYLLYRGRNPRQVPIYVYESWHTQVFLTLEEEPLFGSMRMFIEEYRGFDPYNEYHRITDILMDKLQNNDYDLNPEMIDKVSRGKYRSPLLGLLGAYLYLKSDETRKDGLFQAITSNMQNVILKGEDTAPDLVVLNILAAQHFQSDDFEIKIPKGTPMFRIGFEALLQASTEYADLIPEGSINDFITENAYTDSPFNTFSPINFEDIQVEMVEDDEGTRSKNLSDKFAKISKDFSLKEQIKRDISSMLERKMREKSLKSWVEGSMMQLIESEEEELTPEEIAQKLNVSGNTVKRILHKWDKEMGW